MGKTYRDRGQGGKKGHSNMSHWEPTEIIKSKAKRSRRQQANRDIKESIDFAS